MPIYINSKGEQKETSEMATTHLENALRKAQANGDEENILALTKELTLRGGESDTPEEAEYLAPEEIF